MSRVKFFILMITLFFCSLFSAIRLGSLNQPSQIPNRQELASLRTSGGPTPTPRRDQSVKKWLIPSVRIHVPGFSGSGTICYYDRNANKAYVISCAHLFKPGDSKATIEVFYKNDEKLSTPQKYEAKVISFKVGFYADDISFMSFTPDWVPRTWFPIAPMNHPINNGGTYYSCGCDGAGEVACYFVKPYGWDNSFLLTTENSPRPGRSGGGLMDGDGWYVGICVRTSNPDGTGIGLFVKLRTIHDYCNNNNLGFLLNIQKPDDLLRRIPIIDRNSSQGNYSPDYIPNP